MPELWHNSAPLHLYVRYREVREEPESFGLSDSETDVVIL
jgi:hypothetical protein